MRIHFVHGTAFRCKRRGLRLQSGIESESVRWLTAKGLVSVDIHSMRRKMAYWTDMSPNGQTEDLSLTCDAVSMVSFCKQHRNMRCKPAIAWMSGCAYSHHTCLSCMSFCEKSRYASDGGEKLAGCSITLAPRSSLLKEMELERDPRLLSL